MTKGATFFIKVYAVVFLRISIFAQWYNIIHEGKEEKKERNEEEYL